MGNPDWTALTKLLVDGVDRAVARVARQRPPETFYVLAFVDGYAKEEGPIYPPMVAMNSIEAVRDMHPRGRRTRLLGRALEPG